MRDQAGGQDGPVQLSALGEPQLPLKEGARQSCRPGWNRLIRGESVAAAPAPLPRVL